MIAYGDDPIYPERGTRGYHSDEEPGMYRRRHRGGSSASSPDTRRGSRSRSKSRRKQLAGAGLAAGAAGAGAYAYNKNRDRKRGESEERRKSIMLSNFMLFNDTDLLHPGPEDDYSEPYTPDEYGRDYTPPPHDSVGYDQPQAPYPSGNYFPPPPVDQAYNPADPYAAPPHEGAYNPYPAYNPADYPPESSHAPYDQTRGAYGESDATLGAPYPNVTFEGDSRYPASAGDTAPRGRGVSRSRSRSRSRGRDPGNVSGNDSITTTTAANLENARHDGETKSVGVRGGHEESGMSASGS
jgi:hypothetical protein